MAFEIPGFSYTLVAAVDLSGSQFRAVRTDANGKAALPVLGGSIAGICNNKPKLNEAVTVVSSGISIVEAGAVIANGANVAVDATGRAIPAAAGQEIIGVAQEAASAAGIKIGVLLRPAGRNA